MHLFDNLDPARLRDGHSLKWHHYPEGVLPLWVADMDFPTAGPILEALRDRLEYRLGYGLSGGHPPLLQAVADWQARYGWAVDPAQVRLISGVVPGLFAAALALASAGDEVLVQTPIYPPFLGAVRSSGRTLRTASLGRDEQGYRVDIAALEEQVTPATRLLMLCNPHNPTGRVFTRSELEALAEFALRHRLWVVIDELHADLVFDGQHIPLASLGPEIAERTVTLTGPGKAFNIAGLGLGVAISSNPALLERLQAPMMGLCPAPSVLSQAGALAAYLEGESWLRETVAYLRGNRDLLGAFLNTHLPQVGYLPPEGTYLAWLDFGRYPFAERAQQVMLEAGVGLNNGLDYGPEGAGFLRLNFATSRSLLQEALERIERACRSETPAPLT
ncbi:cystathionine beta-lyase [Deinobacterium chartae]|uniref:cysteine-S-conjugate beta-lyase n=1 Tax=Deinobacterium chartae TaxID=521158 RepID=A0A841HXX3_9DEIO|nr:PatB family C-S lyase [Deinobacterium chartae]MBB6097746.1 cystathionine beta-lyase [Deinobacterium chartae]